MLKKTKRKERKEQKTLSDCIAEKSEQFNSFSKKAGKVKMGLNRTPDPLGPRVKFSSMHAAAP